MERRRSVPVRFADDRSSKQDSSGGAGGAAPKPFFLLLTPPNQVPQIRIDSASPTKVIRHPMQIAKQTDPIFQTLFQSPAYESFLNDVCISSARAEQFKIGLKHCLDRSGKRWGYGVKNLSDEIISGDCCRICPYIGVFSEHLSDPLKTMDPTAWDDFDLSDNVDKDFTCPWEMVNPNEKIFKKKLKNNGVIRGWNLPFVLMDPMVDSELFRDKIIVDQRSMGPFFNHQCLFPNAKGYSVRIYGYMLSDASVVIVSTLDEELGRKKNEKANCYHPDGSTTRVTKRWRPDEGDTPYKADITKIISLDIPVYFSSKDIAPDEEIFISYGPDFIAISPYLKLPDGMLEDEAAWEEAKQEYETLGKKIMYCTCQDCMAIPHENQRSVFQYQTK